MKVFVSSVMNGFEAYRSAAIEAIEMLGHEVISAESFPSTASSSRIACLDGVRRADVVMLILGAAYGWSETESGLSPTHEEFHEARDQGKVIAFVQAGVTREPAQDEFVREVQDWDHGLFRGREFRTPGELRPWVAQALHHHALAQVAQPVKVGEMTATADGLIPQPERGYSRNVGTLLHLAVVGGPGHAILRPAQLEDQGLVRSLVAELTQHESGYFSYRLGTEDQIEGSSLLLTQSNGAALRLEETGALLLTVPVAADEGIFGRLIEEHVATALHQGIAFADLMLELIDPTQKLARVVIAVDLEAAEMSSWRTLDENRRSPNSSNIGWRHGEDRNTPVHLQPSDRPRAALKADRQRIAEDLLTLLRRKFQA
ncbi:MAG: DUF4062 domain-containing protein [Sphingomicrobium sp.]